VIPRAMHAEHLRLIRDRDPWDIPLRLLKEEEPPAIQDLRSEEFVLAYMLSNPGRVQSLSAQDFTGRDRPVIHDALKQNLTLEQLDLIDQRLDKPGYISELRWQTTLATAPLKECIANLKRLRELRELTEAVDGWRKRCSTMTVATARAELARLCFPRRK